jgi:hypothetical protein
MRSKRLRKATKGYRRLQKATPRGGEGRALGCHGNEFGLTGIPRKGWM